MKTMKTIFASVTFILLISLLSFAGNGTKVIAVINHASWCSTCQNHGERAQAAFMENNKDETILFIVNDLSNEETKLKSAVELKNAGLDKVMGDRKATGVVYFFNAETKEFITSVSVAKSNGELAEALILAKKGLK